MSVRPIDIKTTLLVTEDASRLRESQKAQEAGQADHVAQNRNADAKKTETIQKTDAAEGAVVRKEDEEAEKKKRQPPRSAAAQKAKEEVEEKEKKIQAMKDGSRGLKIDLKA